MQAERRESAAGGSVDGRRRAVLFAGGGTGGHLSPGIATAEALDALAAGAARVPRVFACSHRSIDALMLNEAGEKFVPLDAAPFGANPRAALRFARGWIRAKREASGLLDRFGVGAVLSLGGFVAAPVVSAASRRGVPVLLLNLDAVPGKANRLMARRCAQIVSTCDTPSLPRFSRCRVPMPLRRSTLAPGDAAACRASLGLDPAMRTLVVTGASQGSQSLNDLMAAIVRHHRAWLDGWQVYHIAGHGRTGTLEATYREAGVPARVVEFESVMGRAWGAADLAISRAGANSVAEVAANAVPAVFFPYPFHHDQHQRDNAQPLAELRGASVLEDKVDAAANLGAHAAALESLFTSDAARQTMRESLLRHRPENGATVVARMLLDIIRERA
jgi:UDP-N-acetylglucosamine--N-acetylmuramyl-(pentapeptide) pyrophosphoryl-undecaprenol N-acetylglucosamine transferase